jgi:hypothetical protein
VGDTVRVVLAVTVKVALRLHAVALTVCEPTAEPAGTTKDVVGGEFLQSNVVEIVSAGWSQVRVVLVGQLPQPFVAMVKLVPAGPVAGFRVIDESVKLVVAVFVPSVAFRE